VIALGLLLGLQAAPADEAVLIRGARVVTAAGPELAPGAVLLRAGKIERVAARIEPPAGTRVVEADGKVVIPGLVDAGPAPGFALPASEDGSEVTPLVRALDAVDPRSPLLLRARRAGVTTLYVGPGNRNVIGGLGAVVKTAGRTRSERILLEDAALKGAMGSGPTSDNFPPRSSMATFFARRPTTRMGVEWEFRKAFQDARREAEEGRPVTEAGDLFRRASAGKLPVRVAASRSTDLESALRLAAEFGFPLVIEEGHEAWKVAGELARRRVPVLLRPTLLPGRAPPEGGESRLDTFSLLRDAGVPVALLPAGEDESGGLLAAAAFAVRHGARPEEALRAVTAAPAEILGVGARVGSLEAGKDADLVVLSGDPLDPKTRVEAVYVGGRDVTKGR
jgi:imidazolonepropionase-like amidohydrolase